MTCLIVVIMRTKFVTYDNDANVTLVTIYVKVRINSLLFLFLSFILNFAQSGIIYAAGKDITSVFDS